MRLALDTNAYIDFCCGDPARVDLIRSADSLFLPLIVLAELRAGFLGGSRRKENERLLLQFLGLAQVSLLVPDEQTTHHYASIDHDLRSKGLHVSQNDLWIASLVRQHGLTLCTSDLHFTLIPIPTC